MGTPQPVVAGTITETDIRTSSSRLCWVLNRDPNRSYKAEFRGTVIEIPPGHQKIAKHVRDGGNLMEYLEACKFVRDLKQPQEYLPDPRNGQFEPRFFTKELYEQELTTEEFNKIVGKSKEDLKKDAAAEERKARKTNSKAIDDTPNKVAISEDE